MEAILIRQSPCEACVTVPLPHPAAAIQKDESRLKTVKARPYARKPPPADAYRSSWPTSREPCFSLSISLAIFIRCPSIAVGSVE